MNGAGVVGDSIRRAGRYDIWRVEYDMELDHGYTADLECVMRFRTLRLSLTSISTGRIFEQPTLWTIKAFFAAWYFCSYYSPSLFYVAGEAEV